MKLEFRARGSINAPGLKEHAERRAQFALGRLTEHLGRVVMWVEDINGPRGGVDKQCRLAVTVQGGREVVIEDSAPTFVDAVDRVCERAARAVRREIQRRVPATAMV